MPPKPASQIQLPAPHPGQKRVRAEAKRFNWLSAGRRWRKTTLVMSIAVEAAANRKTILWGAPTYDQVRVAWNEAKHAAGRAAAFNSTRMEAIFPGGGKLVFRSLDNPDNARGHTADGVVIDEAADVVPSAWYEVLRPMLMDTAGWAWIIGTPKGFNWFWAEHRSAKDRADSSSWTAPTVGCRVTQEGLIREPHYLENPEVPFEELVQLWKTLSENTFAQEILAQFVESGGGVFRRVLECATVTPKRLPTPPHVYVFGVDWGKVNDFTVISVIDTTVQELVWMDRFNQIDWHVQRSRLKALYDVFRPIVVIAEQNSIGDPQIEALSRDGLPMRPFVTTQASKAEAIESLALAFEKNEFKIINDPVLTGELQAFQAKRLPSGLIRYDAPSGSHDDCVMSLALAWQGARSCAPPVAFTAGRKMTDFGKMMGGG